MDKCQIFVQKWCREQPAFYRNSSRNGETLLRLACAARASALSFRSSYQYIIYCPYEKLNAISGVYCCAHIMFTMLFFCIVFCSHSNSVTLQ
ncbi:hypothetical protein V5799_007100 [Amblyomma americanum]|uniref:Uncharacterized protein n=1 Tax=Amblyomma americanum TaxID=6943 RepID=A0AAQ4DUH9_AMBAM